MSAESRLRKTVELTVSQIDALLRVAEGALNDPDHWSGGAGGQPRDYRHAATLSRAADVLRAARRKPT